MYQIASTRIPTLTVFVSNFKGVIYYQGQFVGKTFLDLNGFGFETIFGHEIVRQSGYSSTIAAAEGLWTNFIQ